MTVEPLQSSVLKYGYIRKDISILCYVLSWSTGESAVLLTISKTLEADQERYMQY